MLSQIDWKKFILSLLVGFILVLLVFGSYNFFHSLRRYQTQNLLIRAEQAEEQGNYQEALNLRAMIAQSQPHNADNLLAFAQLFYQLEDYQSAQQKLDDYFSLNSTNPEAHLLEAKILLNQGDIENATENLEKALELNADNQEAKYLLSLILISQKDEQGSEYLQEVAVSTNAFKPAADFYQNWQQVEQETNPLYRDSLIAFHLLNINQPHLAIPLLESVIEIEPNYRDGHYLLAAAYFETGENEASLEEVNRALEIDSDHQASLEIKDLIQESVNPTSTPEPTPEENE